MAAPEQPPATPSLAQIAQVLRDLGPRYTEDIARHSQQVKELYAPLLLARPRSGIAITRGLRAHATSRRPWSGCTGTSASSAAMAHAHRCPVPVMVAVAEYDNPLLDVYGLEFAHRVADSRGRAPRFVQCAGHNHMSVMAHFDSGDDTLGDEILAFWRACAGHTS